MRTLALAALAAAILMLSPLPAAAQSDPGYEAMLGYLVDSRVDGDAFAGSNGALAVNLAAGDHNLQANLHSLANGGLARADARALQHLSGNRGNAPDVATASIGGNAFAGASGLLSINQASGSGNAELNLVTAALAHQGIRETTDGSLSAVAASAGGQYVEQSGDARDRVRSVAVEPGAFQGFDGVLQLNQVAGSGNSTSNQFALSVQGSR